MPITLPGPGDVLGHFRLIEKVGEGGMGVVFRAHDERLDRNVAVKILNEKMLGQSFSRQRFRQEALTLGRLSHPNVETVYDFHSENGFDYLVIEYVAGHSLDELLHDGPLKQAEVSGLGVQLAKGLAAAHSQGVIHGDLKPSNLRVTPENVLKILDFGLAKMLSTPDAKTVTTDDSGPISGYGGTPPYMAPEQIEGAEPDEQSDIYSAGVVLYEMATGQRPFPQRGNLLREAILYVTPAKVREKNPEITPALESVILKTLQKSPSKRYQSAHELAVELENATAGFSWETAYWRILFGIKRHRWVVAVVLAALLVAGGLGVRRYLMNRKPAPRMSVVVAQFENRTGETVFDDTPRELVSTALGQSQQVYVFPAGRIRDVLKRMEVPANAAIDERVAEEICTREGLQSVVTGSVSKLGSRYVVMARVLGCNGDLILSTNRQFDGPEQLPPAIDTIATTIRREWGESEAAIQQASQPLATVTSGSLEAIRLYSSGKQELYSGNFAGAITLFKKAVELDPNFAMAHEYLATAYVHQGDAGNAGEEYAKAAQLSGRASEKEREKILGDYALFQQDNDAAISHYQVLSVLTPEDPAVYINLAESDRNEFRFDRSIAEVRKALEISPLPTVRNNLSIYLYESGKTDDAIKESQRVVAESPDNVKGLYLLGLYYAGTGKENEARGIWERMLEMGGNAPSMARASLADAAWTRDELRDASRELELGVIADAKINNVYEMTRKQIMLAESYLAMGQRAAMSSMLAKVKQPTDPTLVYLFGRVNARAGQIAVAQKQLAALEHVPNQTTLVKSYENMLQAEIALTQKRNEEAVRFAASAADQLQSTMALETLARAQEAAGDRDEAIRNYEAFLSRRYEYQCDGADWPALHHVAFAQYRLGVLYQAAGQADKARQQFDALSLYAGGGLPTGPMYQDAKARLAQLAAKPDSPVSQPPPHKAPTP
jgi:tetratricopeptide (TPR) repeat protein